MSNIEHSPPDQDLPLMEGPSGVMSIIALLLGVIGMLWLIFDFTSGGLAWREVGPQAPPSIFAVNFSFAGLLVGVATVYRVRRMSQQAIVRTIGLIGVCLGLAGPAVYAKQALDWRVRMEAAELGQAVTIAEAARNWAETHDGHFPPDLETLIAAHKLDPAVLQSPFGPRNPIPTTTQPGASYAVDKASDFVYMGGDLHGLAADPAVAPKIVIVVSRESRLRSYHTVAYADGHSEFVRNDVIAATWEASNKARAKIHLGPMIAPAAATQPMMPGQR